MKELLVSTVEVLVKLLYLEIYLCLTGDTVVSASWSSGICSMSSESWSGLSPGSSSFTEVPRGRAKLLACEEWLECWLCGCEPVEGVRYVLEVACCMRAVLFEALPFC